MNARVARSRYTVRRAMHAAEQDFSGGNEPGYLLCCLQPVQDRKSKIEQDYVGSATQGFIDGFTPVPCFPADLPLRIALHDPAELTPDRIAVIDDKDSDHERGIFRQRREARNSTTVTRSERPEL